MIDDRIEVSILEDSRASGFTIKIPTRVVSSCYFTKEFAEYIAKCMEVFPKYHRLIAERNRKQFSEDLKNINLFS